MKPIKVLFEENITGVGSWDGKYTGSRKPCYTIKEISDLKKIAWVNQTVGESNSKTYFYNFGDGYSSSCTISIISTSEANKIRKKDYAPCREFFVEDILKFGYIRERSERHRMEKEERISKMAPDLLVLLKELRTHVKFKPMPELQKNCPKAKLVNKVDQLLKELL